MELRHDIEQLFARHDGVLYGFADTAWSGWAKDYACALVMAVPYGKQLTPETYTEQDFEDGIQAARARLERILEQLEALLRRHGAAYCVPPAVQRDESGLLAPFSFKYAATRAGLGWIGKNDVVITERYGPRVRLSAVLLREAFACGRPIAESRCPEDCRRCVEACPCRALRDVRWDAGRLRGEIIDYHRCNRMRSAALPRLGRKNACGLCLAACPFGTENAPCSGAADGSPARRL